MGNHHSLCPVLHPFMKQVIIIKWEFVDLGKSSFPLPRFFIHSLLSAPVPLGSTPFSQIPASLYYHVNSKLGNTLLNHFIQSLKPKGTTPFSYSRRNQSFVKVSFTNPISCSCSPLLPASETVASIQPPPYTQTPSRLHFINKSLSSSEAPLP